jgi:hypothetical protein
MTGALRMVKADLRPSPSHGDLIPLSADELVQEICRLYQLLPRDQTEQARQRGPAVQAIEIQIRRYARQHWGVDNGVDNQ